MSIKPTVSSLFEDREKVGGMLLIMATVLALILSNFPWSEIYDNLLHMKLGLSLRGGQLEDPFFLDKSILHWINEGLMAIFFLLIGLELKREMLSGQLSSPSQIALPGVAAVGGMLVPALVYISLIHFMAGNEDRLLNGWAIPSATDIAFSLGILALLGRGVPLALKLYLSTLAVIDDLGAIVIIALFYSTDQLSTLSLMLAGFAVAGLFTMNRLGVSNLTAYILMGLLLWFFVLESGVHATLSGVVLAFAIPMRGKEPGGSADEEEEDYSPLITLEHALQPWVAFGVLPLFALANAGVALHGASLGVLLEPLPVAIALGLFLGKQAGIFGFTWLLIKLRWAKLPHDTGWLELYGVSLLAGIGFTMSLFIGTLAFKEGFGDYLEKVRLGVLLGSALSGVVGLLVLRYALNRKAKRHAH